MAKLKIVFLLLFLSLSLYSQVRVKVLAVHDGDSYKVMYEDKSMEWIRLYGVDCPEVISNHITKNQPFGVQAGDHVRSLLKGKSVLIDTLGDDIYGRMVSKVWLDSIDLTSYLIKGGYAWAYPTRNKTTDTILKLYQEQSQQSKLGLWGLPGRKIRPDTFRKRNWRN